MIKQQKDRTDCHPNKDWHGFDSDQPADGELTQCIDQASTRRDKVASV